MRATARLYSFNSFFHILNSFMLIRRKWKTLFSFYVFSKCAIHCFPWLFFMHSCKISNNSCFYSHLQSNNIDIIVFFFFWKHNRFFKHFFDSNLYMYEREDVARFVIKLIRCLRLAAFFFFGLVRYCDIF